MHNICVCVYIYICIFIYICMYLYIYIYMYVFIYICMYLYIYTCIFIYRVGRCGGAHFLRCFFVCVFLSILYLLVYPMFFHNSITYCP